MSRPRLRLLGLLAVLLWATRSAADICETGKRQSPVDIVGAQKQNLPALDFRYFAQPLQLASDSHTLRLRFAPGSSLQAGAQRYRLHQLHFHTPAGDQIGGETFPMAAHLLHRSSNGQLVAVVVLFRIGAENPWLSELLPLIPPKADGIHRLAGKRIDAAGLLPATRTYYRFAGSLTAPPCTEGVDWMVLKQPIELSPPQLEAYRKRFADNARAVQALNQRPISESP